MNSRTIFGARLTGLLLTLIAAGAAFGQVTSQSGAITGTVADASGSIVRGAKVTLDSPKGITRAQVSGSLGEFTFPLLEPGAYKVTVTSNGFNSAVYSHVVVEVTQATNLPVTLQVGATSTEVTVSSEITLVNPTSATLGNALPREVIQDLPLATRNFTNLLALNAGASALLPNAAAAGRGSSNIFVNGQRGTANNLVINGIDANNIASNNLSSVPIPSPDTIEEFRVQTSLYDASQGKTSGGNIEVLTRGGGSSYHGSMYEFFRNDDLNANAFFFNRTGTQRPELRQNQFGGNFGGPIPKVAKSYFFASYQGTRQINGLSGAIQSIFPVLPAQRTRSAIESAFGLTAGSLDPVALGYLNAKGVYSGNLIPSGTNGPVGSVGSLTLPDPLIFNDNQFNANGDRNISDTNRLSLRYFHAKGQTLDGLGGQGAASLGNGTTSPIVNNLAAISDTWTLRPNLTNEARLGFNRIVSAIIPNEPAKLSDVGMTRFNSSLYQGVPYIVTGDPIPNFGGISTNYDQQSSINTYHFADTVAWTHGKHTVRAGFEYRRYQYNTFNNFASRGYLQFGSFHDFLTGGPIQIAFIGTGLTFRDFRTRDAGAYVQDDYKITSKLTVNLGLRYDYLGPAVDRLDRSGNFDPNRLDANTLANGGPGLAAGFILPSGFSQSGTSIKGTPGVDRSDLTNLNKKNFSPRIGIAWDPFGDGKTAIRAGYGIYYVRISGQTQLQLLTAAPFFQLSNVGNPNVSFANPFPNLPVPSQFPILPALPQITGYNPSGSPIFSAAALTLNPIQTNLHTPYAEHYNLSVQRQLRGQLSLEVAFAGSQGVRLLNGENVNQAMLANAANPIRGQITNSVTNASSRVTVAGFTPSGLNMVTDGGHSDYNALEVTLNRRFAAMFLQASYTFSKSIDNNSASTNQDLGTQVGNNLVPWLGRGLSDFDRTHRLAVTYQYEMPGFGSGLMRKVTGKWSVGGVTIAQSALPISFSCSACPTYNVYGITSGLSPDVVGNFSQISKGGNPRDFLDAGAPAFNSGILATPTIYTSGQTLATNLNAQGGPGNQTYIVGPVNGTTYRGVLFGSLPRNPGPRGSFQQQWDANIARTFALTERFKLRFDGQFFNVFNHVTFSAPSGVVGSSSFGRVTGTQSQPRIIAIAGRLEF